MMSKSFGESHNALRGRHEGGFSLAEVLVSVLVLGLGVIGAAGMQLNAMRASRQAAFQGVAVKFATEMAELIKDHGGLTESGGLLANGFDYRADVDAPVSAISCTGKATDCDVDSIGRFELRDWQDRLRSQLPSARAVICRDASPWSDQDHDYKWDCSANASAQGAASSSFAIKIGWQGPRSHEDHSNEVDRQYRPRLVLVVASRAWSRS
jgi:type IV pilus assembly protein PilV